MRWLIALLLVALLVLHQDFWLWNDKTLVLGFLPAGLAYHAGYSLAAAAAMAVMVRYLWPKELDDDSQGATDEGSPA